MVCAGKPLSLTFNIEILPNESLEEMLWNYYEQF
jgi:hypothetical protein